MPLVADGYKTKKELRAAVGGRLKYKETSIFGPEYPQDGTGKVTIAGPTADTCTWDAEVTLKDHVIVRVE